MVLITDKLFADIGVARGEGRFLGHWLKGPLRRFVVAT
jgi:hypothetical protein